MKNLNSIAWIVLVGLSAIIGNSSRAWGDLMVNLSGVPGAGTVDLDISGNLAGAILFGGLGGAAVDQFVVLAPGTSSAGRFAWFDRPTVAGAQVNRLFLASSLSAGTFVSSDLGPVPTNLNVSEAYALNLFDSGGGLLLDLIETGSGAPTEISFDDEVSYPFDITSFSTGTWTWGTPGGTTGDGATLTISAIPEASAFLCVGTIGLVLAGRSSRGRI